MTGGDHRRLTACCVSMRGGEKRSGEERQAAKQQMAGVSPSFIISTRLFSPSFIMIPHLNMFQREFSKAMVSDHSFPPMVSGAMMKRGHEKNGARKPERSISKIPDSTRWHPGHPEANCRQRSPLEDETGRSKLALRKRVNARGQGQKTAAKARANIGRTLNLRPYTGGQRSVTCGAWIARLRVGRT